MVNKKFESQYIEIGNCRSYSIGYDPITLWASGRAGWFEIQPSQAYATTFNKMKEGIGLYFTITMIYETMKAKYKKSLSLDQVLEKVCCRGLLLVAPRLLSMYSMQRMMAQDLSRQRFMRDAWSMQNS